MGPGADRGADTPYDADSLRDFSQLTAKEQGEWYFHALLGDGR